MCYTILKIPNPIKEHSMSPVIDFHAHAFPDALAPRAIAQLTINAAASGYMPMTDGTTKGLIHSMDNAGISRSVVCNIATNPRQMEKVNEFALSLKNHPRFIPLGSVHPNASYENMEAALNTLKEGGIPGIKIHPDYMNTEIDSSAFTPVFELCARLGLLVVTHAGFDPVQPEHMHCTPDMVLRVMDRHPTLKLVVAHTGGFACESEVLDKLCGAPVWLDTSLSALRMIKHPEQGLLCSEILRKHDPDRILFATDTPWSDPIQEMAFIESLGLGALAVDRIFHGNAVDLLRSCGFDAE